MSDPSPDAVDAAFRQLHVNITRTVAFATDPEICSGPDAITPLERKREIAALLIQFAAQFLAATADKGWANEYFYQVASALRQLNEGIVSPLLTPSSSKGRAREPSCLWVARARVVVAFLAFRKANLSPKDAVAKISRARNGVKKLCRQGNRGTLAATLRHWRRQFREKSINDFDAIELFSEGERRIAAQAGRPEELQKLAEDQLVKAAIFARSAENSAR
jgi:transposase-like protein